MKFISVKKWINENNLSLNKNNIIILYPGSFKPMQGGHLDLIKKYAKNDFVKTIKVLVGPGVRNGIDQDLAYNIALTLTKDIPKVQIEKSKWPSPILASYKEIEEATPGVYALAASTKGDDYKRVVNFTENHKQGGKYFETLPDGVEVIEMPINAEPKHFSKSRKDAFNDTPISASIIRKDVMDNNFENFKTGYPESNDKEIKMVWDLLQGKVMEDTPKAKKLKESLSNKLFEFVMSEYGELEKFEYEDDIVYYVQFDFGKAILTNEFISEVGESYLDTLIGQPIKWFILDYNPKSSHIDNRYRIVGIDEDINESYLFEGGNAISSSRPVTKSELFKTYDLAKDVVMDLFKISDQDLHPVGSFGKKPESATYGDIDIALNTKSLNTQEKPLDYVFNTLKDAGFEAVKMAGFNQVSIGFPINGEFKNGTTQVDFMLSNNMNWTKFAFSTADMSKNETKYKGMYASNLLMAIISESFKTIDEKDENGNVVQYTFYAYRLNSGVFEVTKSHVGKNGLVKTAKIIEEKLLTDDPDDVLQLALGDEYDDIKILRNFEKLWEAVNSPNFIHKEKLLKIIDKYSFYLTSQGVTPPKECVEQYPEIFVVNESLNEAEDDKRQLNTHMRHAEELLFEGKEGLEFIKYIFSHLYNKMTNNPSTITLSVKIDGAPAMMLWSKFPGLAPFGVGTKTVFNKTPVTCHTPEQVEEVFGDRPDLANKLKVLLKYARFINIPEGEIWQGDFLFDKNTLKKEGDVITFKPNTIKYSVEIDSELGEKITSSEFGIAWHTRYLGKNIVNVKPVFDIDLNQINDPGGIYMSEPYIKQISAEKLEQMADSNSEIKDMLESLYTELSDLYTPEYKEVLEYKTFNALFSAFHNNLIRSKKPLNEKTFIKDFLEFSAGKKSDAMIQKLGKFIDDHYTSIISIIRLTNLISKLKSLFLSKLNKLETYKASVDLKQGGSKSINQEGFAISSPTGEVVKIVDREEFFYLNSSPDIVKGWEHA